jgi:cation transport ATPase
MGLSGIAMLFAAFGFISPAAGAILQEGIDVIVILNALRVSRIRL